MITIVLGLGYVGYRVYRGAEAQQCYACQRPIHAHTRTVGLVNGHRRLFCCPACALTEHEQAGKPIQIIELTEFLTGEKLSPSAAFIVKGSDINMCIRSHGLIDADKQTATEQYDRCSPSMLAFGKRSEAVQFAREHGGEVLPFTSVVAAFSR
jgi:hypothetical protein